MSQETQNNHLRDNITEPMLDSHARTNSSSNNNNNNNNDDVQIIEVNENNANQLHTTQKNVYSWIRPAKGTHIGLISRLLIIYSDLIDCFNASYLIGFCLIILLPQVHRSFKPADHDHDSPVNVTQLSNSTNGSNQTEPEQEAHHEHHHDLPIGEMLVCLGFYIFYFIQLIKFDRINGTQAGQNLFVNMKRHIVKGTRYIVPGAFPNTIVSVDYEPPSSQKYLDLDEDPLIEGVNQSNPTIVNDIIETSEVVKSSQNADDIDSCTIAEHHHDCCYELIHQIGDYSSYQQQQRKKSTHQQYSQTQMQHQQKQTMPNTSGLFTGDSKVPLSDPLLTTPHVFPEKKGPLNHNTYGATSHGSQVKSSPSKAAKVDVNSALLIEMPQGIIARRRRIDLYACNQDFLLLFTVLSWISIIDGLMFAAYFNADKHDAPTTGTHNSSATASDGHNLTNQTVSINGDSFDDSDEAQSVLWIQSPDKDEFIKHILYFILHKMILSFILALEYRYHLNRTKTGNYHDQLKAQFDKKLLTSLARQADSSNQIGATPTIDDERSYLLAEKQNPSAAESGSRQPEPGNAMHKHFVVVINENSVICLGFISVVGYLLTTPLGVVIGSIISTQTNLHAVVTLYAVLRAFATGSLLYIAFFIILPRNDSKNLARPLAMVIGFVMLLVVAIFIPYPG